MISKITGSYRQKAKPIGAKKRYTKSITIKQKQKKRTAS